MQIVPFIENLIAGNPPSAGGTPVCEIDAGTTSVPCPDVSGAGCPPPVCQAPIVTGTVGPCKHCRTRQGVSTCSACGIRIE